MEVYTPQNGTQPYPQCSLYSSSLFLTSGRDFGLILIEALMVVATNKHFSILATIDYQAAHLVRLRLL